MQPTVGGGPIFGLIAGGVALSVAAARLDFKWWWLIVAVGVSKFALFFVAAGA
jgi:hypothetical protein